MERIRNPGFSPKNPRCWNAAFNYQVGGGGRRCPPGAAGAAGQHPPARPRRTSPPSRGKRKKSLLCLNVGERGEEEEEELLLADLVEDPGVQVARVIRGKIFLLRTVGESIHISASGAYDH